MTFISWADIKAKVERDLDLEGETFIGDEEILGYCNDAIDQAEAEILGIYPDYFLTKATITLAVGTSEYALPADIYANKIRRVIYNNGSQVYTINRLKDWKKFEAYEEGLNTANSGALYNYFIINSGTTGIKLLLTPASTEAGARVKIWYIRNAARLTSSLAGTNVCDIPEFVSFIYAFMKYKCYLKEAHANLPEAEKELEKERILMNSTLSEMVPDADNGIEADLSFYDEMN